MPVGLQPSFTTASTQTDRIPPWKRGEDLTAQGNSDRQPDRGACHVTSQHPFEEECWLAMADTED